MNDYILVSAPNVQGEDFIKQLQHRRILFATMVNNKAEYERMLELNVGTIIVINTNDEATWRVPELPIGRIFSIREKLEPLLPLYSDLPKLDVEVDLCHYGQHEPKTHL